MTNLRENEARSAPSSPDAPQPVLGELSPALATRLRSLTPARIGLRLAGISVATGDVLDFQLAHGRARDAVHAPLQPASVLADLRTLAANSDALQLHSAAANRQIYLQRPDLGRKLNEASHRRLAEHPQEAGYDICIAVVDGLSALAVERHAIPLLAELLPAMAQHCPTLRIAPICIVEQGRVAIGDEVAKALSASLVVVLIGERPGLSSPDSLGAYITWHPKPGTTTDAERNCISNIRAEGLSYEQASARLLFYIQQATQKRVTGVALKDPDSEGVPAQLRSGQPE